MRGNAARRAGSGYHGGMAGRSIISLSILAVLLVACGGSSSETPWPVEPQGAALGPAGESVEGSDPDDGAVTNEREDPAQPGDAKKTAGEKKETDPQRMRR
jgi:hypothetical protein